LNQLLVDMKRRFLEASVGRGLPLIAVALALWLSASPVAAHSELRSSLPRSGETLSASPPEAVLQFNENARVTAIRLVSGDARRIELPGDVVMNADGEARVRLPDLAPGAYEIEWRAISADGHPIRGTIPFSIGEATTR
jgi:copper resistance protein C